MIGRLLFAAGAAALLLAAAETGSRQHGHTPAVAPTAAAAAAASTGGGIGWLALPATVIVVVCVVGAALAYRSDRRRSTPSRPTARQVHDHWHVILNAQPIGGGPWAVMGRGHREQPGATRAQVRADVEREAHVIDPRLRYRAEVVEAQPTAVR
jgi:hypothetical protein